MRAREIAKIWLPPGLLRRLKPLLRAGIYFSGSYPDWDSASAEASGYDSDSILQRVKDATRKVRDGEAAFERDSVLFDEIQHSYPVLAGLMRAALENRGELSVLDYGGALGSSYFQCRDFLSVLAPLKWGVVEQKHFVSGGRELFETQELRFFDGIADCMRQLDPSVALLSAVLQYLSHPYEMLNDLMECGIRYIVIDRTPFSDGAADQITVQHVPASIYPASYPCRIFSRKPFIDRFRGKYAVVARFGSVDGAAIAGSREFTFEGVILRKV